MSPYVGCCRTMSPYLVYCREVPTRFLNGLKISPVSASKVGSAILVLISQLTRTMSYCCCIHCRLLSCVLACSGRPKQLPSHGEFTTGNARLASCSYMADSVRLLCEYFRQLYDNMMRVFLEIGRDHIKPHKWERRRCQAFTFNT